jgi:hypothetical protein
MHKLEKPPSGVTMANNEQYGTGQIVRYQHSRTISFRKIEMNGSVKVDEIKPYNLAFAR